MGATNTTVGHDADAPIGVFDSGAGGVSVLRALVQELPHEDFIYYGDSANAPYGGKTPEWICARSAEVVNMLVEGGAKCVVIACNTATSAAAAALRSAHGDIPIIGVEPALKPAALAWPGGRILVMATPVTLALEKFQRLADQWGSGCKVTPVACEGLAQRIEEGSFDAPDMKALLERLVGAYAGEVDCVVLGCTHYPLIVDAIVDVLGDVEVFDGASGTARQTRHMLEGAGLLSNRERLGEVSFLTSSQDAETLSLYRKLFAG